ncbi:hypothetical protein ACFFX0_12155 [Citricoccus parietis]|uniref:Uncharacterized protein n=1 Tax=Citricoccus parietis TaxID=592307 RepID=A0ABV5FZS5_9MICC
MDHPVDGHTGHTHHLGHFCDRHEARVGEVTGINHLRSPFPLPCFELSRSGGPVHLPRQAWHSQTSYRTHGELVSPHAHPQSIQRRVSRTRDPAHDRERSPSGLP